MDNKTSQAVGSKTREMERRARRCAMGACVPFCARLPLYACPAGLSLCFTHARTDSSSPLCLAQPWCILCLSRIVLSRPIRVQVHPNGAMPQKAQHGRGVVDVEARKSFSRKGPERGGRARKTEAHRPLIKYGGLVFCCSSAFFQRCRPHACSSVVRRCTDEPTSK